MTSQEPAGLDELIAEYLAAVERGQPPDPADWLARHPGHAAELAEFLANLDHFGAFLGLPSTPNADLTAEFREADAPPDAPPGERFGGYELLGEVGAGGMGVVYRARLRGTSLVVALKQIRPGSGEPSRRFRDEVESAAALRHPNIVPVYHVGEEDGRPYFTMALVEGGSLDRHMARFRDGPRAAAVLVAKVARAVHHAHQRRVLHRDLKPSNILLDADGEPHVADFGLAARLDEAGSAADVGPPAGSLPWMAPEAVRGGALTTAVDVWALGAILYELLTGRRPFRGANQSEVRRAILEQEPSAPRAVNASVPRDLDAVCRRCLAKDPDGRYESASAVALELERWLRDEPVRARPAGRGERLLRWCRRNPGLAGGVALAGALLVAVAAAALVVAGEQESRLRTEVCRGNEYDARGVAAAVLWRLGELGDEVLRAADDGDLHRAVRDEDWGAVQRLLAERQRASAAVGPDRPAFVTMFVLDPGGTIRAEYPPPTSGVLNENFRGRDYFHRAAGYGERRGRDRVHVSRVFKSENDGLDKLALSVPFRPGGPGAPVWVLGATITTGPTLGLGNLHDGPRQTVLIAARDTNPDRRQAPPPDPGPPEYVVLVHRGYAPGQPCAPFRGGVLRPATSRPDEPELRFPGGGASFEPDDNFLDPLAAVNKEYEGRWLAGFAPVGNTELVVLVEQRYDDAVAPHRSFFRRFLVWVAGAVAVAVAAFVAYRLLRARGARAV